jgi:hypothetical protein
MAAANPLLNELLDRVARLELALGEAAYQLHGPRGVPSLSRQAPNWAVLLQRYIDGTTAVTGSSFVGRLEHAVPVDSNERR